MTQRKCGHQLPLRVRQHQAPDYGDVVSASDWVMEHPGRREPTCGTPCIPAKTATATSSSTWKPNHDPDPEVTAMTLTINDTTMTSDQTTHTVWQAPSGHGWQVLLAARPAPGPQRRLTAYGSVARASQPHGDISGQQKQGGERPDPDVARVTSQHDPRRNADHRMMEPPGPFAARDRR